VPDSLRFNVPIGSYSRFRVTTPCGLAGRGSVIGVPDQPESFYNNGRVDAGLLWFHSGFVEYVVSNALPRNACVTRLEVIAELCSEAPGYCDEWPSDITVSINGIEIGTWTSPGDFGGRRGRFTPQYWSLLDTQYGLLKRWSVTPDAACIDDIPIAPVRIGQLALETGDVIAIRFEVRPNARNVGGLNLFGASFGDYGQDMAISLEYDIGAESI